MPGIKAETCSICVNIAVIFDRRSFSFTAWFYNHISKSDGKAVMAHTYDEKFFDWVKLTALRSARRLLPLVQIHTGAKSVADVGCGQGAWLSVWQELGVSDVCGLDGDYVERAQLMIPADKFVATDLAAAFKAGRRFDIAQSLEVAEHLPPAISQSFVADLCGLSDIVMFSAAQPGQGGEMHINERAISWWAQQFAGHGYAAFDCLRPALTGEGEVSPWYKFNTIVYANAAGQARLSAAALASRCDDLAALDVSGDLVWKLRLAVLRPLPTALVSWLSRAHYRLNCALQSPRQAA